MHIYPFTAEAYRLLHHGALALSQVEAAGIRIDVPYLDKTINEVGKRVKQMEARLREDRVWQLWRREYGQNANMDADKQLGHVLFDVMGYEVEERTATGQAKTDEEALERVDLPFVRNYLRTKKMKKLHSTYLTGVRRQVEGEFLHPFFDLHIPITYRGSSSDPNFQNIPIRDKRIAKFIRRAFIAREGHQIIEIDFKGAEVCVSACYHHDPKMITYIEDTSTDMHRDMAAIIFFMDENEVPKSVRQEVKGKFVFAQFYGDWYKTCAKYLWEAVAREELKTNDGTCLYEHLAANGIHDLEDFTNHLKKVEHGFWYERFNGYRLWKEDFWHNYQLEGSFAFHTGFRSVGIYDKNQVVNSPIQGSAFHCLLRVLIPLNAWLSKNKMASKIVGQIHDSLIMDVHPNERDDILAHAQWLITVELPRVWQWICVPLTVEAEAAPVGGSWFEKQEIALPELAA